MTRETDFSKGYTLNVFQVKPIIFGLHYLFQLSLQKTSQVQSESNNLIVAYQKHDQHSCYFGSLAFAFIASNKLVATNAITTRISDSLTYDVHAISDRIKFIN